MKVSEMNQRQKKAFYNIKYAANDVAKNELKRKDINNEDTRTL